VILSQELQCDGGKKGVNKDKTVIFEQTQDITDSTQSDSVDKIKETHKVLQEIKITQAQGVMIFYDE
jgi:hypothetical protein